MKSKQRCAERISVATFYRSTSALSMYLILSFWLRILHKRSIRDFSDNSHKINNSILTLTLHFSAQHIENTARIVATLRSKNICRLSVKINAGKNSDGIPCSIWLFGLRCFRCMYLAMEASGRQLVAYENRVLQV